MTVEERHFGVNDGLFQKHLMVATIKSARFYEQVRDRLCPFEKERGSRRPDFTARYYNIIYDVAARWWEHFLPSLDPRMDYAMSLNDLEECLMQERDSRAISGEDAQSWYDALKYDYELFDFTPDVLQSMAHHPVLTDWLDRRAAANLLEFMTNTRFVIPTLTNLMQRASEARSRIESGDNRGRTMSGVISDRVVFTRPIPCSLSDLNRSLGGGFRLGETCMIAGINGSGKTVLAMQLALEMAKQGLNVAVFTTERKPVELASRILSNHLTVDFGRFTNRADLPPMESLFDEAIMPVIPLDVASEKQAALDQFGSIWDRLYFVDWSTGSMTLYRNFDMEMDRIEKTGWYPNVVVFDWIGGGLEGVRGTKMEVRHVYNEAANILIRHGRKNKRAMIVTAQINKTMAPRQTKFITMSMLAECKTMTDNISAWIGISALSDPKVKSADGPGGRMSIQREQYLNVDKSTLGIPMLIKVEQHFNFQRFTPDPGNIKGGQKSVMEQMMNQ